VNSLSTALDPLRDRAAAGFRRIVSGDPTGVPEWVAQMREGEGVGYFGPDSAAWAVHGGLPTLVGGIRALLMQALHPAALAGVMQHSRYEEDALGRLAGTTQWLTVVTFGDTAQADRECARVRGMHRRVNGVYTVDGVEFPYDATDPDLLRWVHIAFTDSFLRSHQIFSRRPLLGGADAYIRLWSKSVEPLGLTNVPMSEAELIATVARYRAELTVTDETRETIQWIKNPPLPATSKPMYALLFQSAVASLGSEYQQMMGLKCLPLSVLRPLTTRVLQIMRLAIGPESPIEEAAIRRIERGSSADV
jgi:uncharacterized protein (DUF2236 family)